MFITLVSIIHIAICVFLVMLVLLQQGKGADAGAAFGGGSNTFFGAAGADSLLTRVTTITAIAFMTTSILLATTGKPRTGPSTVLMQDLPESIPVAPVAPAAPAADAAAPAPGTEAQPPAAAPAQAPNAEAAAPAAAPVEAAPAAAPVVPAPEVPAPLPPAPVNPEPAAPAAQ